VAAAALVLTVCALMLLLVLLVVQQQLLTWEELPWNQPLHQYRRGAGQLHGQCQTVLHAAIMIIWYFNYVLTRLSLVTYLFTWVMGRRETRKITGQHGDSQGFGRFALELANLSRLGRLRGHIVCYFIKDMCSLQDCCGSTAHRLWLSWLFKLPAAQTAAQTRPKQALILAFCL